MTLIRNTYCLAFTCFTPNSRENKTKLGSQRRCNVQNVQNVKELQFHVYLPQFINQIYFTIITVQGKVKEEKDNFKWYH